MQCASLGASFTPHVRLDIKVARLHQGFKSEVISSVKVSSLHFNVREILCVHTKGVLNQTCREKKVTSLQNPKSVLGLRRISRMPFPPQFQLVNVLSPAVKKRAVH